jgi:hypothetical protein
VTLCWATFLSPLLLELCAFSSGGGSMIDHSLSLSFSLPLLDRGSLSCGDRGSFFNMRNSKGAPHLCRIVVGKGRALKETS